MMVTNCQRLQLRVEGASSLSMITFNIFSFPYFFHGHENMPIALLRLNVLQFPKRQKNKNFWLLIQGILEHGADRSITSTDPNQTKGAAIYIMHFSPRLRLDPKSLEIIWTQAAISSEKKRVLACGSVNPEVVLIHHITKKVWIFKVWKLSKLVNS